LNLYVKAMRNRWLYSVVFISLLLMVILSLGGGIWGANQSIGHWTGKLFQQVCHQIPERSFVFHGTPMAVNSRCFGIFAGLLAGWALIPAAARFNPKTKWMMRFLLFAVIAQIIDYSGNLFGIWENTNISRAILGGMLGVIAPLSIFDFFKNNQQNQ
jgi:uncharacterized membrane protein